MSNRFVSALLIAGWLLAGCSGSSTDGIGPTNPESGNGAPSAPPPGVGDFVPLFRPTCGVLPFPIDLYFAGTTDGTLNLPVSVRNFTPHFDALNALDGFSTTADITLRFSGAIDAGNPCGERAGCAGRNRQRHQGNRRRARHPQPGMDYSIGVSPDIDGGGATLLDSSVAPLVASIGGTNNGYLILITRWRHETTTARATADAEYLAVRTAAIADLDSRPQSADLRSIRPNAGRSDVERRLPADLRASFIGSQLPGPLAVGPTSVVASSVFQRSRLATRSHILAATTAPRPYTIFETRLTGTK